MIGNSRGVVAFGCVHAAIEPGHGDLLMKTDEWQSLQNSDVRFRPLRAPSLARIPDAAIMALGKRVTTAQCPDTLGFEPPQFVLLDTETGMTEIAIVIFHDRTTAHFIQLNWSGGRWVPDKAGFGPTWLN